jgi:hypothetical protein
MSGHYRKLENSENADDLFGGELPKKKHKPKAKPEDLKIRGDSYIDGLILLGRNTSSLDAPQKREKFLHDLEMLKEFYNPKEEKDLRVLLRVLQEHVTKSIEGYDLKKAHDLIVHQEAFNVKACQVAADTNKVKFKKTDGLEVQEFAAKMMPTVTSPDGAASNTPKVSQRYEEQKLTTQPQPQPQQQQPPQQPATTRHPRL